MRPIDGPHKFEKLHGAANDFLFLDLGPSTNLSWSKVDFDPWRDLALKLCHRRRGLGADGLILWHHDPVVTMAIINADGSLAGTCGNALRCLGFLLMRHGLWDGLRPVDVFGPGSEAAKLNAAAPFARLLRATLEQTNDKVPGHKARVEVDMGTCRQLRPLQAEPMAALRSVLAPLLNKLPNQPHVTAAYFVQLANPHVSVFVAPQAQGLITAHPTLDGAQSALILEVLESGLSAIGQHVKDSLDPWGMRDVNLGVLWQRNGTPKSEDPFPFVVHERGAGVTQACGSGCVAAAFALNNPTTGFRMPGGHIDIILVGGQQNGPGAESAQASMVGDAEFVATLFVG